VAGLRKMAKKQAKKEQRSLAAEDLAVMALSDRISFMKAVLHPPQPSETAIQAAKRYKKLFKL
jgi:hypothetical protein